MSFANPVVVPNDVFSVVSRVNTLLPSNRSAAFRLLLSSPQWTRESSVVVPNVTFWSNLAFKALQSSDVSQHTTAAHFLCLLLDAVSRLPQSISAKIFSQISTTVLIPSFDLFLNFRLRLSPSLSCRLLSRLLSSSGTTSRRPLSSLNSFIIDLSKTGKTHEIQDCSALFVSLPLFSSSVSSRKNVFSDLFSQTIEQLLQLEDERSVHFWSLVASRLCVSAHVSFIPAATLFGAALSLQKRDFPPKYCFWILESLLVSLKNDFLVFIVKTNRLLDASFSQSFSWIQVLPFLRKYLTFFGQKTCFSFDSLNDFSNKISQNIFSENSFSDSTLMDALHCLRLLHETYVCETTSRLFRDFLFKSLTRFYSSTETLELCLVLRPEYRLLVWRITCSLISRHSIDSSVYRTLVSFARLAAIRDSDSRIRTFCRKTIRLSINRISESIFDKSNEKQTNAEIQELFKTNENVIQIEEEKGEEEEEIQILEDIFRPIVEREDSEPKRRRIEPQEAEEEVEEVLKDFVFD
ncbi:uncharacterized protein LOC128965713 [Oppia nitens]|uniref:uncharacterized protein LOC128965713 n=1 Tax=Oppia nitens TaxID=1686743 RepID=UPI0023DBAA4B|nr:uncharacterized protein LOC128965713 [Oppia nitens]